MFSFSMLCHFCLLHKEQLYLFPLNSPFVLEAGFITKKDLTYLPVMSYQADRGFGKHGWDGTAPLYCCRLVHLRRSQSFISGP